MAAQRTTGPLRTSVVEATACTTSTKGNRTCTGSSEDPYPLPRRTNLSLPALGPWTDWQTPTEDDFKSLIDGWQGDSPLAWLHKNAGFRNQHHDPAERHGQLSGEMWFRDSFGRGPTALRLSHQSQRAGPARPARLVSIARTCPRADAYDVNRRCHEDPSTIDFSDIQKNYTQRWSSGARSNPATTGIPSGSAEPKHVAVQRQLLPAHARRAGRGEGKSPLGHSASVSSLSSSVI